LRQKVLRLVFQQRVRNKAEGGWIEPGKSDVQFNEYVTE
jgi:hypothetical protein